MHFDDVNWMVLEDLSRSERGGHSMQLLSDADSLLSVKQSIIHSEACAVAAPFNEEGAALFECLPGPFLLASVRRGESILALGWRWDMAGLRKREREALRLVKFPSLPPGVFRYPRSCFRNVETPLLVQVLEVEADFAVLRKRYAEIAAIRALLSKYKKRLERWLQADTGERSRSKVM